MTKAGIENPRETLRSLSSVLSAGRGGISGFHVPVSQSYLGCRNALQTQLCGLHKNLSGLLLMTGRALVRKHAHAELDYLLDNDRMAIRERNLLSYLVTPKRFHSAELPLTLPPVEIICDVCIGVYVCMCSIAQS